MGVLGKEALTGYTQIPFIHTHKLNYILKGDTGLNQDVFTLSINKLFYEIAEIFI